MRNREPEIKSSDTRMNTPADHHQVQRIIHSYADWLNEYIDYGWQSYLLTFMFDQLPGSDASRMTTMKTHLEWFYGRLAKASVPRPSNEKWSRFVPRGLLAPDLPIVKHSKALLRDVTVNNGIHWHGLAMVHPMTPNLRECLDLHIRKNISTYLVGSIREINIGAITHRAKGVTRYGLKGIKRSLFSNDDVLIFPRSISELPIKRAEKESRQNGTPYRRYTLRL
jgi:hypothetical protein